MIKKTIIEKNVKTFLDEKEKKIIDIKEFIDVLRINNRKRKI